VNRWRRALSWFVPITVGLVLRLPGLEARPIWYDEAFSILLSARTAAQMMSGTAADTMPPLYYFLLGAWQSVGDAIWQQRMLNVILGTVLVAAVYLLGQELYGRATAGWAATLAAISPLLVFHAQELRMYTLLALSLTLYVYFYLLAVRVDRRLSRWLVWPGIILAGTAALYTHNLAIFSLVAVDIFAILRREWRNLGRLVLAQSVMLFLFLPWLRNVPGQIQKIQEAFWTPRPGVVEVIQGIVSFHASLPLEDWLLRVGVTASLLAFVLTLYLSLRRLPRTWKEGLLSCLVLVPPLLLFAASYIMRPVFVPRAFMLSLVAYLVLGGRAIAQVRPRAPGWTLAGAFVVAAVVGLWAQSTYRGFPRSPFREATVFMEATAQDGDFVLHSNKLTYFPMHVYAPDLPQSFLADKPGSHNDTLAPATQEALGLWPLEDYPSAAEAARRVRYVIFQREQEEYAVTAVGMPPALSWLHAHATLADRTAFNDLWVYDFEMQP
jgi:4-amino-4-deoxy-L-arabinose transferase-like glycosyltransferase